MTPAVVTMARYLLRGKRYNFSQPRDTTGSGATAAACSTCPIRRRHRHRNRALHRRRFPQTLGFTTLTGTYGPSVPAEGPPVRLNPTGGLGRY